MQKAYLMALYELAKKDPNVLSLVADSGTGFDALFQRDFPGQFYDFGIAEENMVAAAAGMASCGKVPFVYTAGAFLAFRACEFIRIDACLQRQNVKIIGMGSGLAWSTLGPSHHTTEDISVLRAFPHLTILSPACPHDVGEVIRMAYEAEGPVYVRLGMNAEPDIYDEDFAYADRTCEIFHEARNSKRCDATILFTGSIASEGKQALSKLEAAGFDVRLVNVMTIKPFDEAKVPEYARTSNMLITVEEHNRLGGLGSIVAEVLAETNCGVPLRRIGLCDVFAAGYGELRDVRRRNKLDSDHLADTIAEMLRRE